MWFGKEVKMLSVSNIGALSAAENTTLLLHRINEHSVWVVVAVAVVAVLAVIFSEFKRK